MNEMLSNWVFWAGVVAVAVTVLAVWMVHRRRSRPKTLAEALALLVVAVLYALMPVDLTPEVMFGPFGLVDDALFLGLAVRSVGKALAARWRFLRNVA